MGFLSNFRKRVFRQIGWIFGLLAFYLFVVIGYFHIPWTVRHHVYDKVPVMDRILMKNGYTIMSGWDDLAFFGRDAEIDLQKSLRGDSAYAGFPRQGMRVFGRLKQLDYRGFSIGYSEKLKNPQWAAYRLFDVPNLSTGDRPSYFRVEKETRSEVRHDDYTNSGFDRGHLAPNFGIATRYGRPGQLDSFHMTNVMPQNRYVNRGIWKDLEMRFARHYGRYFGEIWVITGPIFPEDPEKLPSGVAVPTHYYKIVADEQDGQLRTLAFVVEAKCPPWTRIRKRLVSIDFIEERTELDFFSDLPDPLEEQLEAKPATRLWPTLRPAARYNLQQVKMRIPWVKRM